VKQAFFPPPRECACVALLLTFPCRAFFLSISERVFSRHGGGWSPFFLCRFSSRFFFTFLDLALLRCVFVTARNCPTRPRVIPASPPLPFFQSFFFFFFVARVLCALRVDGHPNSFLSFILFDTASAPKHKNFLVLRARVGLAHWVFCELLNPPVPQLILCSLVKCGYFFVRIHPPPSPSLFPFL